MCYRSYTLKPAKKFRLHILIRLYRLQSPGAVPLGSPPAYGQSTSGGTSGAAGSTPPPATDDSGVGSTNPPPPTTDNNGVGSTNPSPPTPSTDNNGVGCTGQPPPAASYGAGTGSTYQPPWMTLSSASTLHDQLWLLLPAVLLLFLWSFSP